MIKNKLPHLIFLSIIVGLLLALGVSSVMAQSTLANVTIKATDPLAKEPNDNGLFTVYRANSSSVLALTVHYTVSGTATNGVDYVTLSGTVVIPAGALSAPIPVVVRDDSMRELPETVIATLTNCPGPVPCYSPIAPSSATVTIYDND